MTEQEQHDILGKKVRVTNPHVGSSWEGELIGFANHPTLILACGDGRQIPLPQSFTIEVTDPPAEQLNAGQ